MKTILPDRRITEPFLADHDRLTGEERTLFRQAVREINDAYAHRGAQAMPHWPAKLRMKRVSVAPGVWEMTWSFAGPEGRATFEFIEIDGEPAIRWRRIGGHEIFRAP
jgi:hypothetical protein